MRHADEHRILASLWKAKSAANEVWGEEKVDCIEGHQWNYSERP